MAGDRMLLQGSTASGCSADSPTARCGVTVTLLDGLVASRFEHLMPGRWGDARPPSAKELAQTWSPP